MKPLIAGDQLLDLLPGQKARPDRRQRLHRNHAATAVERGQPEAIAGSERVHPHLLTVLLADKDLQAAPRMKKTVSMCEPSVWRMALRG